MLNLLAETCVFTKALPVADSPERAASDRAIVSGVTSFQHIESP